MNKRLGFTLAEVLITLGIIGVVAAMTIPTLMNQTGGAEFKAGFKKAVSVLNQAVTMNVALDGADFSTLKAGDGAGTIYAMFTSRMNVVRVGGDDAIGGAFGTGKANYTLFFQDGMVITFPNTAASCAAASATCRIVVDVNGIKKPNTFSTATSDGTKTNIRDQFTLNFFNQQVLPAGSRETYVLYN